MVNEKPQNLTLQQLLGALRGAVESEYEDPLDRSLNRVAKLADFLDNRYAIPGTNFRIGWDPIIGLIPVVGDTLTAGIGAYIVREAARLGARKRTILRMVRNLSVDWLIGLIPFVDILFDFGFKANARNARLLLKEWEAGHLREPKVAGESEPQWQTKRTDSGDSQYPPDLR